VAYFVARPPTGWAGNQLDLTFYFDVFSQGGVGTWAEYGIYGYPGTPADVYLDSPNLGMVGMLLVGGMIPFGMVPLDLDLAPILQQPAGWPSKEASFMGDLSGYEFLGVAFTVGGPEGSVAPDFGIDNVRLDLSPEPATMTLGLIGLAVASVLRRRRRK